MNRKILKFISTVTALTAAAAFVPAAVPAVYAQTSSGIVAMADSSASTLTANQTYFYGILKAQAEAVVNGTSSSTVASADISRLTGTSAGWSNDIKVALDYLRYNSPELVYWAEGSGCGIGTTGDVVTSCSAIMTPSSKYAGSAANTVKSAEITAANNALNNAKTFASSQSGKSVYEKITAFNTYICGLTEYNEEARQAMADNDTSKLNALGNGPWQLIYVFDGDPATNVVCEGYAKAFQYLCNLSGIECHCVSGTMSGGTGAGPHMWNIVAVDGKSYLVDITNCDGDSVGNPDKLLLKAPTSVSSLQYTYNFGGSNVVTYAYDSDTLALYSSSLLTLAAEDMPDDAGSTSGDDNNDDNNNDDNNGDTENGDDNNGDNSGDTEENTDAKKVAEAKKAVETAANDFVKTVNYKTVTQADIETLVANAVSGKGVDSAAVSGFAFTPVTRNDNGELSFKVTIKLNDESDTLELNYLLGAPSHTALKDPAAATGAEAEAIKAAVKAALEAHTTTNKTNTFDIDYEMTNIIEDTLHSMDYNMYSVTYPSVELKDGGAKAVYTVRLTEGGEPITVTLTINNTPASISADLDSGLQDIRSELGDLKLTPDEYEEIGIEGILANLNSRSQYTGVTASIDPDTVVIDNNKVTFEITVTKLGVSKKLSYTLSLNVPAPVSPVVYYSVGFAGDYIGSGITVSSLSNAAGAAVTVNVPVGYSVDVVSGNNRIATITDGSGTFTMPAGNVTLRASSYIGMLSQGYKNAYIYSYDSSMNLISTNSVRGGMTAPEGEITVKLGSEYAGKTVTLYSGRKSTSSKVDEAVLNSKGQAAFTVKSGKNYTLVVE
ncbi:MAG: hypothetical protein NC078_02000 [Ruminococcus sp.]|nr:hypothetical protein [Ruminococcus sp.]